MAKTATKTAPKDNKSSKTHESNGAAPRKLRGACVLILTALSSLKPTGSMSRREIGAWLEAKKLPVSRQRVADEKGSYALVVEKGYVSELETNIEDKIKTTYRITAEGKKALKEAQSSK